MKFIKTICAIGVVAASVNAGNVMAKVSPEQAARLGQDLTPVGAEKAGNADGTIPEWTGGMKELPAGWKPGMPYVNPFPEDKVLFTINKDNMAQYADKLSEGQMAMMSTYPTRYMQVYKTRRSAMYSDQTVAWVKENALIAEMIESGNGIKNPKEIKPEYPFPIPNDPRELLWNHIMRKRGGSFDRNYIQVTPMENGSFTPVRFYEEFSRVHALTDAAKSKEDNVIFYFKQSVTAPARLAGNVLLVHETLDQVKEPRRAWVYNAGQRRVRRAPQVAYDGPGTASDGLRTTDNFDMFNGAPDRYDWKLVGKQEMYIPYHSYKLDDKSLKYDDIIKAGHLNSEYLRYELHRVWKIEATLKAGSRHIYSKRVMYLDEDSWGILGADLYDGRGELWRVSEAFAMNFYDIKTVWVTVENHYDLSSRRYVSSGLANEVPLRYDFSKKYASKDFTPAALRRAGRR